MAHSFHLIETISTKYHNHYAIYTNCG